MPKKKPEAEHQPKDPRTVKHGCCSCVSYKKPMSAEPCKSCKDWTHWEDAYPGSSR